LSSDTIQGRIQEEVGKAISAAVERAVAEHYKFTTTATKTVRAKKIGKTDKYVEMFPVRVVHTGTEFGRDAAITIAGCDRSFRVVQNENRPQHKRSWQTSLPGNPAWHVYLDNKGKNVERIETTEDFESAVQNCIVALIGHVYYDGVSK
jgi:hypothetical protein